MKLKFRRKKEKKKKLFTNGFLFMDKKIKYLIKNF